MPCDTCHIGGFGPQLTVFGRQFKMDGYTMRAGNAFTAPVSAMAVASFLHTSADQASAPAPHYSVNDNATLDQASLFVAGGISDNFGGFSQWTYDGVGRSAAWDNLDLRAVTHATVAGSDVLLGLSLNNAPGVQDSWNTLAAWGFPYTFGACAGASDRNADEWRAGAKRSGRQRLCLVEFGDLYRVRSLLDAVSRVSARCGRGPLCGRRD